MYILIIFLIIYLLTHYLPIEQNNWFEFGFLYQMKTFFLPILDVRIGQATSLSNQLGKKTIFF